MKVAVFGLDAYFQRSVSNLIQLFFEETTISFENERSKTKTDALEQLNIFMDIDLTPSEIRITVEVMDSDGISIRKEESALLETERSIVTKKWNKGMKHAVNRPLLHALEQYTGTVQPWGILTGIRPTKLMHHSQRDLISLDEAEKLIEQQYLVKPEKTQLMSRIVRAQQTAIPDLYQLRNEVSIYIGIPYCPTKCAYCTFPAYAIKAGPQSDVDSFLYGLHYEIEKTGKWLKERGIPVTTIYFGGGTPTSITAEEMDRLYDVMTRSLPMDQVREITVEAGRPDTITVEKLNVLNKWGIDRISINPQTYTQETLKAIGRHHTVEETIEKFHLARQMGMNNINMDLIIGLPGEGLPQFNHTLEQTAALMPESLTVHTLSFKRASEMTRNRKKYPIASRAEVQAMMRQAEQWTAAYRYQPYYLYRQKNILGNLENVGYALAGQESLYNILIMEELQTIVGIGCGAASKLVHPATGKIERIANPKEPRAYNERFVEYTERKLSALESLFLNAY